MKYWYYTIGLWVAIAMVQVTVLSAWRIHGAEANLVVATLAVCLLLGFNERLLWQGVLVSGVMLELLGPIHGGWIIITQALILLLLVTTRRRYVHYPSLPIILVFAGLCSLAYDVILAVFTRMLFQVPYTLFIQNAFYTSALSLAILGILWVTEKQIFHPGHLYIKAQ